MRDALFEEGRDVGRPDELAAVAHAAGLAEPALDERAVIDDWQEGEQRGVIGTPHFFVGDQCFFCPSLHIEHTDAGLRVRFSRAGFDDFLQRCLAP